MHARVLVILFSQETKSWDVPNLELPRHVCYWFRNVAGFKTVSHHSEIQVARREMYSDVLRVHSDSGRVRSRFG